MKDKNNDNKRKLYDALSKDYELGSYEQFCTDIQDDTKRKKLYDATSEEYDYGDYDSFSNQLGFGKADAVVQSENPLTEQDKIRFSANMGQMKRRTEQMMDGFNEQMETMREYQKNAPLGGGQTAEGKMKLNPESGKLEKTYITPLGNRYTSKGLADMESFRYRQAADMSVNGQLRRARLKLAELQEKRDASAKRVHEQWEEDTKKNTAPLGFLLAADTYVPRQMSDKENRALDVAIHDTEELISRLERQQEREQGVDVGYWRGFGSIGFSDFDLGMGDLNRNLTRMHADDLNGENATEGEREAYNEMMGATYKKKQAEQMYPDNWWYKMGVMSKDIPAFALDFYLTGYGFKGINVLSKAGMKAATKVVGKEVVEQMAEQGFKTHMKNNGVKGLGQYATNWTIKALGTTADDLLLRAPLMTNTVQAGKTTADIIDRKLGDVVVDENGNYDFSNDRTWGNAIWQGEANAIVENYSEMFGSHLDPVVTLGNMSKLANVVGAKRIGAVLSKADAGALNGIMGQTHRLFNKMGVSDYFGEVTEEYYGQLWRTMLNLDDAYQQNPDGTRTNLLATGQFHGDIWGGMALSMGLMGAGKATLSGVQYASMKHGVNKADARATELLGKEIWEPLRATIDLTTNDDIGSVAEGIVNDKDFSDDERAAVLTYMERSLMMRGFNLGTLAQKRGGEQDEDVQSMNESYIDGYNLADPQEMTDAKNMRDYQRERMKRELGVNDDALAEGAVDWLNEARNAAASGSEQGRERADIILDYLNAKQVYDGMIQRVRDDIDARVEQSNAMVDARTNRTTGMIQGATMKQDDRRVYVVGGNLVQYADGSGIDNKASDGSIIVRDAETGALEQVSPDAVLNIDEPLNPSDEKMTAEEAIIRQFAQEASDKIDGVVTFNPGDTYTITGDDAQIQVQIVANEDGIVDNGDGTVNVSDGVNIFPLAKETIQQQADAANLARVAQFEQQRAIENAERKQAAQEADRPQYAKDNLLTIRGENGNIIHGNVASNANEDEQYEVYTEIPINGKKVNLFSREELDGMVESMSDEDGNLIWQRQTEEEAGNNGTENIPENGNNTPQNIGSADLAIPAMQRIPKDEQGNPLYEQTDSDTAWDAIVEQTEGDEDMAQTVADGMVADKEEALKKLEKAKSKGGNSIAEKIASEKERKAAIDAAKQELLVWQKIAGTAKRRKMEADDERRRIADEAAALRKAEEEKLRAEREEAERIEREALNGVPDMVDDKPQDARARGYRRMNGHKIDRQEPVQALQGKQVSVKFSDDVLVGGHAVVIDANQLQPSHSQGVRNPLHFIDEAQPKERNDEERKDDLSEINEISSAERTEMESRIVDWLSEENLSRANGKTREEIFDEFGNELMPIAYIPTQFISLVSTTLKDQRIYCGKGYFIDHALRNHARAGSQISVEDVDVSKYLNIQTVLDNPDHIKETSVDGKRTIVFIKKIGRFFAELTQVEENGKIVLHKSFFNQKKEPYAKLNDIRQESTSSEGGTSSISHADNNAAPAISLESRGDVISKQDVSDSKGTNNSVKSSELGEKIAKAEAEVDVNPTDKQKEAGNYKKGHVQVGVFDITIEQPKGSVRSGVDANGNKWETTMQNTYGYIRGTKGVDGDHIDVFLSDDIDGWNGRRVFVVDQYNEDGSFDEHKVMLGFNETDDAEAAYFANYDSDWAKKHKTVLTAVNLEDFEKWIDSSHRKTKAFAEYKSVKSVEEQSSGTQVDRLSEIKSRIEELHKEQEAAHGQSDIFEEARIISEINDLFAEQRKLEQSNSNEETTTPTDAAYTITPAQYTTKRGKVLDMHLVKFNNELRDTVRKHTTMFAKQLKGWWDKEKQGFMMRSKEDAERLAEYATDAQSQPPLSLSDLSEVNDGNVQFAEPQLSETPKQEEKQEYTPVWQYSVSVDKKTGLTTLKRDDVSGPIPVGDARFTRYANSPEEMLGVLQNPSNGMQEVLDAVGVTLENAVAFRKVAREEKENPRTRQPASSHNGQDLTTGHTADMNADSSAKVRIFDEGYKSGARYELGKVASKYAGKISSRGFIGDLAGALGYHGKPKQSYYFSIKADNRETIELGIINHNVNAGNADGETKEISLVIKIRRQPGKSHSSGRADVTEYVYFKEDIAKNSQALAWIAQDISDLISSGEYNERSGIARINRSTKEDPEKEANPSGNRLVTDERYAELRERMRKKLLGQMNMGIDPEILAIGTEMAVYHLEKGARKFTEYATAMVADLGDAIRPYLKAFYNGARDLPEVAENGLDADMTPYDEVQQFDVTNFDKKSIDALATAETVTREAEVEQEAEIAQERIKKSRPARKKNEKKAVISQQSNELGLFDALTDNNKNSEHGLQRTDAERSERVPAKGYRQEQGLSRGTETGSESEQQAGRGTDSEGERTGDAVDRTVRPRLSDSLNERSIEGKRKKEIENNRKLADELKGVTLHLNDKLGGEHEISGIVYYELANVFHCNDCR